MYSKIEVLQKIDGIIQYETMDIEIIDNKQKELAAAKEKKELAIVKFDKLKLLIETIPEGTFGNPDPYFTSFADNVFPIIDNTYEFEQLGVYRNALQPSFIASTSTIMASGYMAEDIGFAYYETQKLAPGFKEIESQIKSQKPIERKDEMAKRLENISPKLKSMFNTAWQSYLDESKERDIILPAHAMRELLSEFLQILAPNEKVEKKEWCEWSKDGKIIHLSRARFAVFGDKEIDNNDPSFKLLKTLMKDERCLYHNKLSPYAHYRDEELPPNYRLDLEIYLATLQNIMMSILDMRSEFYIESE